MNKDLEIKLVNHASLLIKAGNIKILTDPWFSGTIFNNGWSLVEDSPLPEDLEYDYVWISHEHPDHFTPSLFNQKNINNNKKILIQKRENDKKLKNFFESKGYDVYEITKSGLSLGSTIIKGDINKSFDSWMSITHKNTTFLNLNDCVSFKNKEEINLIRNIIGDIDVLAIQYSFANWTGNIDDPTLPMKAKKETFDALGNILEILDPTEVIPFANFTYFSHEDNHYLNKNAIAIRDLIKTFSNQKFHVLRKGDTWTKNNFNLDNDERCKYWESKINLALLKEKSKTKSISLKEIRSQFDKMKNKLYEKNNMQRLKDELIINQAYTSSTIYIQDLGVSIDYNIFEDITVIKKEKKHCDITIKSDSLLNVMKFMWGFGTLMINGRFQANYKTFDNFVLQTRLYYMNNIGKFFPENIVVEDIKNSNSLVRKLLEL